MNKDMFKAARLVLSLILISVGGYLVITKVDGGSILLGAGMLNLLFIR